MKKLFTLIAAALMAVGASAEEKVVISTPITIEASAADKWGGSDVFTIPVADVASGDFLKIYIGVAEAGEGEQNVVQFRAKDDASVYYGSDFYPAANDVITIPVNDAILAVLTGGFKFGGCIQQKSGSWSAVPGKKVVIDKISVVPATDYSVVSLYDEAVATSGAWKSVNMGKANFQIAKAGDIIVANFNAEDANRNEGNFQFVIGGYKAEFWVVPPFAVINVIDDLVTKMASGQFYYQGAKFPFTVTAKLYRQKDGLPTNETSLEVPATELGKWENSVSIAKDKFANVAVGDEIHVLIADWKSVKYDGESWTRTAQLQLKSGADGNPALECSAEVADAAGVSEVVFILTATDVTAIQENGLVIGGQCATINGVKLITAKAADEGGEEATGVTYQFNNQASTYVLGENYCAATTYSMDGKEGFSVNYTGGSNDNKMQVKLAANEEIFFEYSNSQTKNNAVKTGENYMQCDSKNFVINIPVKTGDVIYIKYSAKGGTAAALDVYGSEPAITADAEAVKTCSGKTEGESVIFKATATKGGTAKIKETSGGMRVYAISINQEPTGIQNVKVADAKSANGAIYNLAGQKVNESYKGIVIKNGKKYIQK